MTKSEAIQSMQEGKKVTHIHFMAHEYIYQKPDGRIFDENEDWELDQTELWKYRAGGSWETGWSIFKP